MSEGRVEALYGKLKAMAVDFRIRPGERLNEVALARELDASRTPLREALNRLVAERLIDFQPGRGFFCRTLDPERVYDLYEMRQIIEEAAVGLATERGSDAAIRSLRDELYRTGLDYQGRTVREVTAFDEAFHIGIAKLTGNAELVRQLANINERIRFIRWVDMASKVRQTKGEHRAIMEAIEARDAGRAVSVMRTHIRKRKDQIVASVKEGYSNIYMPGEQQFFERAVEAVED